MFNKKRIAFIASSLGFVGFTLGASFLASSRVNAQAQIFTDFACAVKDGSGNLVTTNNNTKLVIAGNGDVSILQCQGQVTPPPDGKAVVEQGFLCITYLGETLDSSSVVSSNGVSILTCRINN